MPAIAPVSPNPLKCIPGLYGYKVSGEDQYNWVLIRQGSVPIIVPKLGELIALDVLKSALDKSKMENSVFLSLLAIHENELIKNHN